MIIYQIYTEKQEPANSFDFPWPRQERESEKQMEKENLAILTFLFLDDLYFLWAPQREQVSLFFFFFHVTLNRVSDVKDIVLRIILTFNTHIHFISIQMKGIFRSTLAPHLTSPLSRPLARPSTLLSYPPEAARRSDSPRGNCESRWRWYFSLPPPLTNNNIRLLLRCTGDKRRHNGFRDVHALRLATN